MLCEIFGKSTDQTHVTTDPASKNKRKLYAPFIWIGFDWGCRVLQGDSLLFTTNSPGSPGTHLIDLGRMKGWVNLGVT